MTKILVIDLGTSYLKFALFDRLGQMCDLVRYAPPARQSPPGRVELEAADVIRVIEQGVIELGRRTRGLSDLEAVSFATQTNSFLLLNAEDQPLTPIIPWPDQRAESLLPEIAQRCALPGLVVTTGVPALNSQFMLAKLLWLQLREPQTWRRAARLCLFSDYLTLLLTGQHVTEAGTAGLTALVDIHRCQWWAPMLARLELNSRWLPDIVRAGTDLGPISAEAACRLGLPRRCRFIVGCLDQYAGAIGAGNVRPGRISETTGTVLATVRLAQDFSTGLGPSVFQGPAPAQGQYWCMTFGEVSANYLQWYRDLLPDHPDFDALTALAAALEPGASGLTLIPTSPLSTPSAVFRGWTPSHTRGQVVRCILESVAAALRDQVTALSAGVMPEEIRSAGGAARSPLWLQIKADVLGIPVRATQCAEPTSLGAAVLAESALTGSAPWEIAERWVCPGALYRTDPQRHQRYQELWPALPREIHDPPTR